MHRFLCSCSYKFPNYFTFTLGCYLFLIFLVQFKNECRQCTATVVVFHRKRQSLTVPPFFLFSTHIISSSKHHLFIISKTNATCRCLIGWNPWFKGCGLWTHPNKIHDFVNCWTGLCFQNSTWNCTCMPLMEVTEFPTMLTY